MKFVSPNRLSKRQHDAMFKPLTTAMIAFRMGRAQSEHYHEIANAVMYADAIAELVARNRHVRGDLKGSMSALNSIFHRQKQRTIADAPWSGTPDEVDEIELGVEIYKALVTTTPGKVLRRAMTRYSNRVEAAFKARC